MAKKKIRGNDLQSISGESLVWKHKTRVWTRYLVTRFFVPCIGVEDRCNVVPVGGIHRISIILCFEVEVWNSRILYSHVKG